MHDPRTGFGSVQNDTSVNWLGICGLFRPSHVCIVPQIFQRGHDIDQHGEDETGTLEQAALDRNGMHKSVTFIT
jgi:hypothetical protein